MTRRNLQTNIDPTRPAYWPDAHLRHQMHVSVKSSHRRSPPLSEGTSLELDFESIQKVYTLICEVLTIGRQVTK